MIMVISRAMIVKMMKAINQLNSIMITSLTNKMHLIWEFSNKMVIMEHMAVEGKCEQLRKLWQRGMLCQQRHIINLQ